MITCYFFQISRELGEEIDELPYKRPSRRGIVTPVNIIQPLPLQEGRSDCVTSAKANNQPPKPNIQRGLEKHTTRLITRNLLASRRIIDKYNVGDLAGILSIIEDAATIDCDVCIFPLNQHVKGRLALVEVWEAMHEAFPDGVFRASDTTINDEGELTTRFIFSGARQFNIRMSKGKSIDNRSEIGEISAPRTNDVPRIGSNTEGIDSLVSSSAAVLCVTCSTKSTKSGSCSRNSSCISLDSQESCNTSLTMVNSGTNGLESNVKIVKKPEKHKKEISDCNKSSRLLVATEVVSVSVDYSSPLIRSSDLLVDDAKIEAFEGVMVMHTNESYQINRLDYHWKAVKQ